MNISPIKPLYFIMACLGVFLAGSFTASAQVTWSNSAGGDWTVGPNWNTGNAPTSSDAAYLNSTTLGSYAVTYSSPTGTTINGLTMLNSAGNTTVLNVVGAGTVMSSSGSISLGVGSTLHVGSGATFTMTNSAATSKYALTGAGSSILVEGTFIVNNASSTQNTLENGASITVASGGVMRSGVVRMGTATGNTSININSGATATFSQILVGRSGGGNVLNLNGGELTLTGAGSPNAGLIVGQAAGSYTNTFSFTAGTLTNSVVAQIGITNSGTAIAVQSGGTWVQKGDLTLGTFVGTSTQNSTFSFSGGVFSTVGTATAVRVGAVGNTGNNTLAISGGTFSAAQLDIQKGTTKISGGSTTFTTLSSTIAGNSFQFTGGALTVSSATTFTTGDSFNVGDGTAATRLNLAAGTHTFSGGLAVADKGQLFSGAAIVGNVSNGGTMGAGTDATAGVTDITGTLTSLSTATYKFELGSNVQGTGYDYIHTTGTASVDGLLSLSLLSGFTPTSTDTFTIMKADGGLSGLFDNVANGGTIQTANGLGTFVVTYTADSIILSNYAVPEPSSIALMGVGVVIGVAALKRRLVRG